MQAQSMRHLPGILPNASTRQRFIDLSSPAVAAGARTLLAGGLGVLCLAGCLSAWVWLIGFQPCALSSLLWR